MLPRILAGLVGFFFLAQGVNLLLSRAAGILLATIAVARSLAWAVSGAAFAAVPIAVECITAGLLFFSASRLSSAAAGAESRA